MDKLVGCKCIWIELFYKSQSAFVIESLPENYPKRGLSFDLSGGKKSRTINCKTWTRRKSMTCHVPEWQVILYQFIFMQSCYNSIMDKQNRKPIVLDSITLKVQNLTINLAPREAKNV